MKELLGNWLFYLALVPLFFFLFQMYFRLSYVFKIFDVPNHRSSHKELTIRGAGIVFLVPVLISFFTGLIEISFTLLFSASLLLSFYDDVKSLSSKLRLLVHMIIVLGTLFFTGFYDEYGIWLSLVAFVFGLGMINAFNFMDGINGITVGNAIVILISFILLGFYNFTEGAFKNEVCYLFLVVMLVFAFYNFRKKAKCFCGDVGSVSFAVFVLFNILQLIVSGYFWVISFVFVFGIDTSLTIVQRVIQREDILEAHRQHLYQVLVDYLKWDHRIVTFMYAGVQLLIILVVVLTSIYKESFANYVAIFILLVTMCVYVVVKGRLINRFSLV